MMTDIKLDVLALALEAGLMVEEVEGSGMTYWSNTTGEEALEAFVKLVLAEVDKRGLKND